MMNIKKRTLFTISAAIAIILLEILFVILPSVKKINSTYSTIADELQTAEQLTDKGHTILQLQQDMERIQSFIERLDGFIIDTDKQLDFIIALESLATTHGVDSALTINDIPDTVGIVAVPISLTIKGGFTETLSYVHALEQLESYINIKSFSINTLDGGAEPVLQTSLSVISYWENN